MAPTPRSEERAGPHSPKTSVFEGSVAKAIERPPGPHRIPGSAEAKAQGHTVKVDALLAPGESDIRAVLRRSGRTRAGKNEMFAFLISLRDGTNCCYCTVHLTDNNRTIEHVVPVSVGGTTEMDNLKLACDWCNQHRSDRDIDEFLSSYPFRDRYARSMREKSIDLKGGGFAHAGPVQLVPGSYPSVYRCDACGGSSEAERLDATPCVEVVVLPLKAKSAAAG